MDERQIINIVLKLSRCKWEIQFKTTQYMFKIFNCEPILVKKVFYGGFTVSHFQRISELLIFSHFTICFQ